MLKYERRKKEKKYIPYEFAKQSLEPCLVDKTNPKQDETNRVIISEEKNLLFLGTNFSLLNEYALRIMSDLAWQAYQKNNPVKISRVSHDNPFYGFKWYTIRFSGCLGKRAENFFLIIEEDVDLRERHETVYVPTIPGARYLVKAIQHDTCDRCGGENCRFKIRPESKNIRCGVCLGLLPKKDM